MSRDIIDRRVQKTRQLLKDALIALILEKGFEAVTINEILDRANVGRSTFYIHFENKYELLHSCFEKFHDLFEKHNPEAPNAERTTVNIGEMNFILNLLKLIEQNYRLFRALLGKDGISMFNHTIYHYIFTYFNEVLKQLAQNKKQTQLQLEMLVHYMTSAFIGTLKWWVDKDMPYSVEEMDKYFKKLIMYDIKNFIGSERSAK